MEALFNCEFESYEAALLAARETGNKLGFDWDVSDDEGDDRGLSQLEGFHRQQEITAKQLLGGTGTDNVLQHFEHVLITLEGDGQQRERKEGYVEAYGCPWDILLGYEYLFGKMEVYKATAHRYPDPEHFKVNINLCWKKLYEYYSRLDEMPVYYAAIALHPAYRWGYFEDVWRTAQTGSKPQTPL
ncbi:putative AC9 transposase [Ilyonectria robusta]